MKIIELSGKFEILSKETSLYIKGGKKKKKKDNDNGGNGSGTTPPPPSYSDPLGGFPPPIVP